MNWTLSNCSFPVTMACYPPTTLLLHFPFPSPLPSSSGLLGPEVLRLRKPEGKTESSLVAHCTQPLAPETGHTQLCFLPALSSVSPVAPLEAAARDPMLLLIPLHMLLSHFSLWIFNSASISSISPLQILPFVFSTSLSLEKSPLSHLIT